MSSNDQNAIDGSSNDVKSRLKASYDAIAPEYNRWTSAHSTTRLGYVDQLLSQLPTSSAADIVSVLEIGCGNGIPTTQKLLSHPNFYVTANDLSTAQIELARANLLPEPSGSDRNRITFVEGDMLALDFSPATLDAVVGMYSIIHLPRNEQVEMLGKIANWLKPGGWFLANFGTEEIAAVETQNWLEEEKGWMFWSGWGSEGTKQKVKEAGLEIVMHEIVEDVVDGVVDAKFLWILAKTSDVKS